MFIVLHVEMFQGFFYTLRLSKPNHFMLQIFQYLDSQKNG
jgi:hypothetical protein